MAAITRLGLDGYGVRRAGSFSGKPPYIVVLAQLAKVSAEDGVVTGVLAVTGIVTRGAAEDGVVTRVSITEWPA